MRAVQVGRERCLRALRPGEIKRHPLTGPLYGYAIACPECGFRALHDTDSGLVERDGKLVAATKLDPCPACGRRITLHDGEITACSTPDSPASAN